MSRFVLDLVLYYACALSAESAVLPAADAMRCSHAYEQAKTHFYAAPAEPPGTPARADQSNAAFAAFRAWETANPSKVASLKAMAREWRGAGPAA